MIEGEHVYGLEQNNELCFAVNECLRVHNEQITCSHGPVDELVLANVTY